MLKSEQFRIEYKGLILVKLQSGDWRILDPRTGLISGTIKEKNLEAVVKAMVSGSTL